MVRFVSTLTDRCLRRQSDSSVFSVFAELYAACAKGNLSRLKQLLPLVPEALKKRLRDDMTVLMRYLNLFLLLSPMLFFIHAPF